MVRHKPHDFSDLPDLTFQTLIRDLLSATYPERRAVEYGGQGSKQYGIDVLVGGKDRAVFAQVKRTARLEPGAVRELAEALLPHLDNHWQGWSIEAFVVAVSGPRLELGEKVSLRVYQNAKSLHNSELFRNAIG